MKKPLAAAVLALILFPLVGLLFLKPSPSRESLTPLMRIVESEMKQVERLSNRLFPISAADERAFGTRLLNRGVNGRIEKSPYQDAIAPVTAKLMEASRLVRRFPNEYFFIVVSSDPRVNAFAMPGGYVAVGEGLVKLFSVENSSPTVLRNADAVAFVLAHEIGHVELLHAADGIRHTVYFGNRGVPPVGGIAELIRSIAHPGYSEIEELEADAFALRLMKEKGFRLEGATESLGALATSGERRDGNHAGPGELIIDALSDYPNSHPLSKERLDRIKKGIEILNARG